MDVAVSAVSWVVRKALAPVADGFLEAWAASEGLGPNIDALKMQLLYAQAMLNNTRGREIDNPSLNELLHKLRGLAYDADDVLDELEYFRIQDALHGTYHAAADVHAGGGCIHGLVLNTRHTARSVASKLKLSLTTADAHSGMWDDPDMPGNGLRFHCCARLSKVQLKKHDVQIPKLLFDRVEISRKMKDIVEQLKPICGMVSTILNLELIGSNRTTKDIAANRPKTTPEIIEPKLYGRDDEVKRIVDSITRGEYFANKLTVLPIVGPGGIGKTAFAQKIYQEVKSHFQVPIWICVSQNFNANRLAHDIVNMIPPVDGENKNAREEEIIEQRLKSKRFLLILDDIWTCQEDEWKKLLTPYSKMGGKGNMVIVTTRFPEVAKMVRTDDCFVELGSLGPEDFMSFFGACVFGHEQLWSGHDEFLDVGREIVKHLKGSPLAAKTVGRLLRNQPTLEHWRRVLRSKEWELQTSDNDIMPALKLSYHYLPFHLQQCFSYCALFPEDHEFDSNELIHLWIGLDILHSLNRNKGIEDVGHSYLDDLVKFAFLKKNERDNGRPYYVVHDLLHELAAKVSSYECLSICSSNIRSIQIPPSVRHLSIIVDDEDVKDRVTFEDYKKELSALDKTLKVENLRTVMLFGEHHGWFVKTFGDLFREARALRTIFCYEASYNVEDLLPNFSEFVHLRHLRIKKGIFGRINLPNTTSRLYQLRILDLERCNSFSSLPRDISNLINLHHFLVSNDGLHSKIFEVGKLKHLKELSRFEVKMENNGFELKQLGQLLELQVLGIYNLEKVKVKEEADEAKLIQKDCLRELTLDWDLNRTAQPTVLEENVLERLKPHSNLQKLCIRGHRGLKCPTWLGVNLSVQNLEHLHLDHVAWQKLPPLGDLRMVNEHGEGLLSHSFKNLKSVELVNMKNLEKWVENYPCHLFSQLEVLVIRDCDKLLELPFSHRTCCQPDQVTNLTWFRRLRNLQIKNCPKLLYVTPFPWITTALRNAYIQGVGSGFAELWYRKDLKSEYCSLEIVGKDAPESTFWKAFAFYNLTELKELKTNKCPVLAPDHLQMLSSLQTLSICNSSNTFLDESGSRGNYKFPVESITISRCGTSGKELTRLLSYFPKLSNLKISYCPKIAGLGVVEQQTTATTASLPSSSANNVEGAHIVHLQQQQEEAKGEEEIAASATEGLLLLPPQLQELKIASCKELSLHPNVTEAGGIGGGLQCLRSLRSLEIWGCPKLFSSYSSSPSSCSPFPSSLQKLSLWDVNDTEETLVSLSNLASLTRLDIRRCGDLRCEGLWSLLTQGHLTELSVFGTHNLFVGSEPSRLHEQVLPPRSSRLQHLVTDDAAGVLAAPICSLLSSSLTSLYIQSGYKAERVIFTKEQEEALQRLTSLQDLKLSGLQCLAAGLHRPANLKTLEIFQCAIRSLPKERLPSSLQELRIRYCPAIRSLPKEGLPSSLQELTISNCPAIRSLPKVERLPSSLRVLDVRRGSDELRRQCRKLKGIIPIVKA
ncbi:putative disease resistance protein RGA3 [Phragmites australis]|uniref:putative disease resistance protein RGA3 n=1 Tax=Phragmites australis TaxID=29695 RepID=UPI002D77BF2F|nr:putative disease resistance protein RGA3 [Phragmites australis]XP_062201848.1 putative disease resistance protein RGA3 [Phragmites australis]XP_062201849.1 putative disease resistance protein RGA3 [Phragmites australis]XP_062201850.1 putative disease resistance protein RGA3 [Phragmites australis]XP_062201851.1 putative disease resistance protein RGA3 [Phragmites australis]XP_062201852.1 putative disease resistance protein RGA3 [Phragmites australis]XP_062201853.1 putative disease resistanc